MISTENEIVYRYMSSCHTCEVSRSYMPQLDLQSSSKLSQNFNYCFPLFRTVWKAVATGAEGLR